MTKFLTGILVIVLAFVLPAPSAQGAVPFQACDDCHGVSLEKQRQRMYVHSPFSENKCATCHLESELTPLPPNNKPVAAVDERQKILWLGESSLADTSHWFLVPAQKMSPLIIAEGRGSRGSIFRKEIAVPALANLAEVEDTGRPPVISGVRVLEVQRGLFLSATIAWETDVVADAWVRYGQNDLNQVSLRSNRFGRKHEIVLTELKPGKDYRYSVVSNDVFRRQSVSAPLTFSTAKPFAAPPDRAMDLRPPGKEVPMGTRFRKAGENYLLELSLEQPASLFIGTKEGGWQQSPAVGKTTIAAGNRDESHAGLNTKFATTMQVCDKCHRHHGTSSHPVNVYPKRGMIIPQEYPTLPDGRMTCMSCHETHGSDKSFRLIKESRRELCVGCHRNMQ